MLAQYTLYLTGGGLATVSTQSTAVQLSTTPANCQMVQIQAVSTNTGCIVVCNSTARALVTNRVGIPMWAGSTNPAVIVYAKDISQVYIDGISTESVSYTYYTIAIGNS